jgi:hypothetical protein
VYIVTLKQGRKIVDVTAHKSSTNAYNSIEQWLAAGVEYTAKLKCIPQCRLDVADASNAAIVAKNGD